MALCLKISRALPPSTFPQLPYWSTLHSSLLTRLVPSYTCFYSLFSTQHPEEPLKIGVKSGQSKSYTEEITVARRALHDLAVGISLASSSHIGLPACSAFLACLALSCTGLPLCWEVFPISSLPHLLVLSQMSFFSLFEKYQSLYYALCPPKPLLCSILFSHNNLAFSNMPYNVLC